MKKAILTPLIIVLASALYFFIASVALAQDGKGICATVSADGIITWKDGSKTTLESADITENNTCSITSIK